MTTVASVDPFFVKQFEREVYEAYQRNGSKLRQTVRNKLGVRGTSAVFRRIASNSNRANLSNVDFDAVEATLLDYYAGEWVDSLDQLKKDIDERAMITNAAAYALGRKTDELIVDALQHATNAVGNSDEGMTKQKFFEAWDLLASLDVPNDGQRYAIVGWKQWSDLLSIPAFAEAEYASEQELPWRGSQAKMWHGTLWMPHTGLPVKDGIRTCLWYHKCAVGHASGDGVSTDITWHDDRSAHFIANSITQGAVLIHGECVVKMPCKEI